MKKFINRPENGVEEMLEGLTVLIWLRAVSKALFAR